MTNELYPLLLVKPGGLKRRELEVSLPRSTYLEQFISYLEVFPIPTVELSDGTTHSWSGDNVSYCAQCKEVFNSVSAFDRHLCRPGKTGAAEHVHPADRGMIKNKYGRWIVASRPGLPKAAESQS